MTLSPGFECEQTIALASRVKPSLKPSFPLPRLDTLRAPPPWLWCGPAGLWQRLGPCGPGRFPLEAAQQLHWWLIRPFRSPPRSPSLQALPWGLTSRACWLNSYRPSEVAWWWAMGVRTWRDLSRHPSNSLAWTVHARRRRCWPGQCRSALRLLQDKAALLASAPEAWRSPHLVLDPSGQEDPAAPPPWWERSLEGPGVVVKPLRGHGGRAVIRFRLTAGGLEAQPLFRPLPEAPPGPKATTPPLPWRLRDLWQSLSGTREAALATPYLPHSPTLPLADPSAVVRVITARGTPEGPISLRLAWLEVPLEEDAVAFLNLEGRSLPRAGPPLSLQQRQNLHRWQVLLKAGVPPCVDACLRAALRLHATLPPIDQVAWDWIPADPQPLLLEGNGGFGLLVPQLFERLNLDRLPNP